MRVTSLVTREQRTAEILQVEEKLSRAQDQVSSGLRVQRPSDAPDQIADLLRTRSEVASLTRRRDGADAALSSMQASESALSSMSDALREARNLTLQANN